MNNLFQNGRWVITLTALAAASVRAYDAATMILLAGIYAEVILDG